MRFWRAIIFPIVWMATVVPAIHAAPVAFPEPADLPVQTNLPDVMTMLDGTKVTSVAQWSARREEMKAVLEHYELGHAPPPPGNVTGKILQSKTLLDGAVKFQLVHLSFGPKKFGIRHRDFHADDCRAFSDDHQTVVLHDAGREFYEFKIIWRHDQ